MIAGHFAVIGPEHDTEIIEPAASFIRRKDLTAPVIDECDLAIVVCPDRGGDFGGQARLRLEILLLSDFVGERGGAWWHADGGRRIGRIIHGGVLPRRVPRVMWSGKVDEQTGRTVLGRRIDELDRAPAHVPVHVIVLLKRRWSDDLWVANPFARVADKELVQTLLAQIVGEIRTGVETPPRSPEFVNDVKTERLHIRLAFAQMRHLLVAPEMRLAHGCRVIAGVLQLGEQRRVVDRQFAAVVPDAVVVGIGASDERHARWLADRRHGVAIAEPHALVGKRVDDWRFDPRVTGAAHGIRP